MKNITTRIKLERIKVCTENSNEKGKWYHAIKRRPGQTLARLVIHRAQCIVIFFRKLSLLLPSESIDEENKNKWEYIFILINK